MTFFCTAYIGLKNRLTVENIGAVDSIAPSRL
jgi:hypothetical protein